MYYCDVCGWQDASVEDIEVCPVCGAPVRQDEDVLDTWFSSQLWPFATQGWGVQGANSPDLKKYYPTQLLSTARDIMGLWVARMVMASEYCMEDIPFQEVIIHPTVMGADGKPMSKSRGNGVDPVELMENYGADGMRFGLLTQVTGNQAIKFDVQKIESARNFANKIKNAARFVEINLDGYSQGDVELKTDADKWIFSRLTKLVKQIDEAYSQYEFSEITRLLYTFFWNEFCDWYIEFSKPRLSAAADADERLACQRNLVYILNVALRLLHPIMPFITESIYDKLPKLLDDTEMLIMAKWPDAEALSKYIDDEAELATVVVCDIVGAVRSARARYGLSPKEPLELVVKAPAGKVEVIKSQADLICALAKVSSMEVSSEASKPAESAVALVDDIEVYTILSGLVDFEVEKTRLAKEIDKLEKDAAKIEKKLSNPGFLAKAAQEVIDKDKARLEDDINQANRLKEQLKSIG